MNGADLLRGCRDELLTLLVTAISDHVPGFNDGIEQPSHPLRRQRQKALHLSLVGMADAIDARHGVSVPPMDWSEHIELGRLERRYARPLGDILRAPWAASHTIVRFANERASAFDLPPAAAQEVAEVVIDWSDRISIAFSEGYNDETAARAGELETRRRHLLRLVLADPPATADDISDAARTAEWSVVPEIRVLVVRGPERHHYRRRLPSGSLAAEIDNELCALIPEPSETDQLAAPTTGEVIAALGPPVALGRATHSARLARRAITLAAATTDTETENTFIDCTNNELDLVVLADIAAATEFTRGRLGPTLDDPKLLATLYAWLANDGRPKAAAAQLGVHPHTITYRIDKLRRQLGSIVDDPAQRLELLLATHIALRSPQRISDPVG